MWSEPKPLQMFTRDLTVDTDMFTDKATVVLTVKQQTASINLSKANYTKASWDPPPNPKEGDTWMALYSDGQNDKYMWLLYINGEWKSFDDLVTEVVLSEDILTEIRDQSEEDVTPPVEDPPPSGGGDEHVTPPVIDWPTSDRMSIQTMSLDSDADRISDLENEVSLLKGILTKNNLM